LQRRDLGAQLGQRWHGGSLRAEQVVIPGHDLPERVQALGNRSTVRSELPRGVDQRLDIDIDMQDLRRVAQD
jgi:hypothetical protein